MWCPIMMQRAKQKFSPKKKAILGVMVTTRGYDLQKGRPAVGERDCRHAGDADPEDTPMMRSWKLMKRRKRKKLVRLSLAFISWCFVKTGNQLAQ